jgi:hypothetical protein
MTGDTMELARLVGKLALLFTFVYLLALAAGVVALVTQTDIPISSYELLILPAIAFTPATVDAIRLHRTTDPDTTRALWRRCGPFTLFGVALLIYAVAIIDQSNPS